MEPATACGIVILILMGIGSLVFLCVAAPQHRRGGGIVTPVSPSEIASGGLIVAAIVLLGISLYIWSPVGWREVGTFALTVIVWLLSFGWYRATRQAGAKLLDLRPDNNGLHWAFLLLAAFLGTYRAIAFLGQPSGNFTHLSEGLFWLSIAVNVLLERQQPLIMTEQGFYRLGSVAKWSQIIAYHWTDTRDDGALLILHVQRPWPFPKTLRVRVPLMHRSVVTALLTQRVAG